MLYQHLRATLTNYHKPDGLQWQIYFLTVWEDRSLKSSYQQGHDPIESSREKAFSASSSSGGPSCSLAYGSMTPLSASSPHGLPTVSLWVLFSYEDTNHWIGDIGYLIQYDLILITSAKTLFLCNIRSHCEVPSGHGF